MNKSLSTPPVYPADGGGGGGSGYYGGCILGTAMTLAGEVQCSAVQYYTCSIELAKKHVYT
jgi:hypothetical protein